MLQRLARIVAHLQNTVTSYNIAETMSDCDINIFRQTGNKFAITIVHIGTVDSFMQN